MSNCVYICNSNLIVSSSSSSSSSSSAIGCPEGICRIESENIVLSIRMINRYNNQADYSQGRICSATFTNDVVNSARYLSKDGLKIGSIVTDGLSDPRNPLPPPPGASNWSFRPLIFDYEGNINPEDMESRFWVDLDRNDKVIATGICTNIQASTGNQWNPFNIDNDFYYCGNTQLNTINSNQRLTLLRNAQAWTETQTAFQQTAIFRSTAKTWCIRYSGYLNPQSPKANLWVTSGSLQPASWVANGLPAGLSMPLYDYVSGVPTANPGIYNVNVIQYFNCAGGTSNVQKISNFQIEILGSAASSSSSSSSSLASDIWPTPTNIPACCSCPDLRAPNSDAIRLFEGPYNLRSKPVPIVCTLNNSIGGVILNDQILSLFVNQQAWTAPITYRVNVDNFGYRILQGGNLCTAWADRVFRPKSIIGLQGLPPGLSMPAYNRIAGIPTQVGSWTVELYLIFDCNCAYCLNGCGDCVTDLRSTEVFATFKINVCT